MGPVCGWVGPGGRDASLHEGAMLPCRVGLAIMARTGNSLDKSRMHDGDVTSIIHSVLHMHACLLGGGMVTLQT